MKTSKNTTNKQSKQGNSKKARPEIRDEMDSHKTQRTNHSGDKKVKSKAKKA
ncbi:MAG: hypothetical protein ACXVPQ_07750 [Bacteroidia bacterium]